MKIFKKSASIKIEYTAIIVIWSHMTTILQHIFEKKQMKNMINLNTLQKISIELIRNDLRYIFTAVQNLSQIGGNYFVALFPYIGLITDGAEDWLKAFNNSSKQKISAPLFDQEQQVFFEKMRESIKLWDNAYDTVFSIFEKKYIESELYFSSVCKPIAKALHLYDIFGAYIANKKFCGNTILCSYYVPFFELRENDGKLIGKMTEISGKYTALFSATSSYKTNPMFSFDGDRDYGGFVKSPVGNYFSDKFVLFSILCQINFIIECVDGFIDEEISTKLRFSYLLYFYLLKIIPQINEKLNSNFSVNRKWFSEKFRNAMAHYKMGIALKENEINYGDLFFGLTQKYLNTDYFTVKNDVINYLRKLAYQIDNYLGLKGKIK